MKYKNVKNTLFYMIAIAASIFGLFFVVTCTWIGYDVKTQCRDAQRQYEGDCVTALSALLLDERQTFRVRNSAIWALGQLGDVRALPVLEQYSTGIIPPKEPLDQTISQYELKKAVQLVQGGLNISAPLWRAGYNGE